MRKIIILNSKGGVGKSNLVRHLAVAAEQSNPGKVVMCDTDPQSSLADWWNARGSGIPPLAEIGITEYVKKHELLAGKFDYLFMDTAAADAKQYHPVLATADLIIIPVLPSPDDVRSLARLTLPVVTESGRSFVFVISKARPGTKLLSSTIAALSKYGSICPTIIQQRESYAKAAFSGLTVLDDEQDSKAD